MASRSAKAAYLSRMWFPLALVGLLLLAIPGVALFVLYLLRRQALVNRWLEDTFSLTYHIHIAWWGALLLLFVPFALVLLYFLKLRRKPLQVPSTFLWRKSIEDVHVNSLFQWLRDNVLLLLQLLVALCLIFAVMAFQVHGSPGESRRYIILIDNSASMAATDVLPSRLGVARQEALQTIDSYTDNDAGMVIVFNYKAKILQSFTTERNLLRLAVKDITQSQSPTQIEDALSLADSLANPQHSTEEASIRPLDQEPGKERTYVPVEGVPTDVHLFSDGGFRDVPGFSLGSLNMNYHAIGQSGKASVDNIALVGLAANWVEGKSRQLDVLASVRNYRSQSVPVKVELEVRVNGAKHKIYHRYAGEQIQDEKQQPDATVPRKLPLVPARSHDKPGRAAKPGEAAARFLIDELDNQANIELHAELVDLQDNLAVDNKAWLVVGVTRKARVLVVTKSNDILDAFFQQPATRARATVTFMTPDKLKEDEAYRSPARDGSYDLVIFDRCAPEREEEMPLANTFFIDAIRPPWKRADMPRLENPRVKGWDSKDVLLRSLANLQNIELSEAFRFELDPRKNPNVPARALRLLESDRDAALLFALDRRGFTDLVMAFPLINGEGKWSTLWPRDMSFLLFMYNVLNNLGNVMDAAAEKPVQPGSPKVLRPDAPVKQIEVIDPAGNNDRLERGSRPAFTYDKTDRVGIYQVKWDGKVQRSFAVNLFDAEESNIEPRAEIGIGSSRIRAGEMRTTPKETWMWFALCGLILLTLEWFIYNRRIFI